MATPRKTRLRAGFDKSVAAARHVQQDGVHAGAVAAGRALAEQIDNVIHDPEAPVGDKTKAMYLVPHLMNVLRELMLTPASVATKAGPAPATDDEGEDALNGLEAGHSGPRLVG